MSGAVFMSYVLPMMLGHTYDLAKDIPGVQIFNETAISNNETIVHYFTDSHYRMVDDSSSIKDLLDIQGKLSLKVKAGLVDIAGQGSYLRDRSSKSHSTEILIRVNFETITQSIPSRWSPETGWSLQERNFLGSHYCRSITYGGDLIASVRFLGSNHFDQEKIKGAIQAGFNANALQSDLGAKLEKLSEELHDTCSMEVKYYATVPLPAVSYDIDGLMKLVEDFPKHVKTINGGMGNPLRMELYPLSALDNTFTTYLENRALNDHLEDLEEQFDDLMATKKDLTTWINKLPPILTESIEEKISNFVEDIETLIAKYYDVISNLDLSLNNVPLTLEALFEDYRSGTTLMPNLYEKKLRQLQMDIYKENPELNPVNSGATFVHWGNPKCGGNEETTINGIGMASEINTEGGSSTFHCAPISASRTLTSNDSLTIIPLRYTGTSHRFNQARGKIIHCAICRATRSTTVTVFYAFSTCPSGWNVVYSGLVMAPNDFSTKGEYICVDDAMKTYDSSIITTENNKVPGIVEVTTKCGILPCDSYQPDATLKCVVCAKDSQIT